MNVAMVKYADTQFIHIQFIPKRDHRKTRKVAKTFITQPALSKQVKHWTDNNITDRSTAFTPYKMNKSTDSQKVFYMYK